MSANLFQQMYRAICSSMGKDMQGGIKKRGIKIDRQVDSDGNRMQDIKDHTYGWNHFKAKVDRIHNFADFVKEHYGKVDYQDLTQEMKLEYLLSKHTSNGGKCNTASILTYDQQLVSIGHLCDKFYKCNVGLKSDKSAIPDDNVMFRTLVMKPQHFKEAMAHLSDKGDGKFGAQLGYELGIRASSTVKLRFGDLHFDRNVIDIINAKGGKDYNIPMPQRTMDWLAVECEKRGIQKPNDRLIKIKAGSVEKALYRALKRAGHDEYAKHKTGNHASRKYEAQQFYTQRITVYLELGKEWKIAELNAKKETSLFLGHGSQRTIGHYISRYESEDDYLKAIGDQ